MNKNIQKKNRNNNNWRSKPSEKTLELLGIYQECLCMGYTDENWTRASRILKDMSRHVDLQTRHELGNIMSAAYGGLSIQNIIINCENVALRLQQSFSR